MILTLVPDSVVAVDAPWAAVGAASIDAALADASDASYVQGDGSIPGAVAFTVGMSTQAIPAGGVVNGVRLVVRMNPLAGTTTNAGVLFLSSAVGTEGVNDLRLGISTISIPMSDGQQRLVAGVDDYIDDSCGVGAAGVLLDQSGVDAIVARVVYSDGGATTVVRIYALRLEVDVQFPPTVVLTEPPTEIRTPNPTVAWTISDDGEGQPVSEIDLAVYSPSQYLAGGFAAIDDPGIYNVTLPFLAVSDDAPIAVPLTPGLYRVYVRARKPVGCAINGAFLVSPVAYREFTVLPLPTLGRVRAGVPARLGCGIWEAIVCRRGGDAIGALPLAGLSGTMRVVNETAQVTITVPSNGLARCRSLLTALRPFEHEVVLVRDGREQFIGLPGTPTMSDAGLSLPLSDLGAWADVRLVARDRDMTDLDLAEMWLTLWSDVLAVENSMGLRVSAAVCGVTGSRRLPAGQSLAGDALRSLLTGGVDSTVILRDVVAGGLEVPLPALGTLVDLHTAVAVVRPLTQAAGEITALGQGGGAMAVPLAATAGGIDTRLGLVQRVISVPDARSVDELQAAADSALALLVDAQVVEATLSRAAPWAFEQLVAGAQMDVQIVEAPIPAQGLGRIERVSVDASAGGDGWSEAISVVVQPRGTE